MFGSMGFAWSFKGMPRFCRIFIGVNSEGMALVSSLDCMSFGRWRIVVWFDIIMAIIMRFMNLLFSKAWFDFISDRSFRDSALARSSVFSLRPSLPVAAARASQSGRR